MFAPQNSQAMALTGSNRNRQRLGVSEAERAWGLPALGVQKRAAKGRG